MITWTAERVGGVSRGGRRADRRVVDGDCDAVGAIDKADLAGDRVGLGA